MLPIVVALSVVSTLLGCGTDSAVDETRLRVVTSVAPITSIGRAIGGDRISLVGMVPQGVNSHTYEPPPSAARELSHADLVILNGLQLEEPLLRLARANLPGEGLILLLGDLVVKPDQWIYDFSFPETAGRPNPHVWTDPLLALRYAEEIEVTLSELDPPNAGYYAANLSYFREQVDALDEAIVTAVSTIPEGQRRLLTYHDSWPYFAMRYGFEVLGAVQPVDFADPSPPPREVAALIDQVRRTEVPAIFGSAVFRSTVLETRVPRGICRGDRCTGSSLTFAMTRCPALTDETRRRAAQLSRHDGREHAVDDHGTGRRRCRAVNRQHP